MGMFVFLDVYINGYVSLCVCVCVRVCAFDFNSGRRQFKPPPVKGAVVGRKEFE